MKKVSVKINKVVKSELISSTVATFEMAENAKTTTVVNRVCSKLSAVAGLGKKGRFSLIKTSAKIDIEINGQSVINEDMINLFSLSSNFNGLTFNRSNPEKFKNDLIDILEQYDVFFNS